jgi:hypothetical protein
MSNPIAFHAPVQFFKGVGFAGCEKLGFRVGRGFIPGTYVTKSLWALAPEVRLSVLSPQKRLIASEISQKRTSGPKGPMIGLHLCRG